MGLDTVELVMAFEEEFGIDIPNEAAEDMIAVRHVRHFVVAEYTRLGRPFDPDDIYRRIVRVTSEHSSVDPEKIDLDTEFVDDLGMD